MHTHPEITAHPMGDDAAGSSRRLVLASASPRRRELLAYLYTDFTVCPTDAEASDNPVPAQVIAALPPFPLLLSQHPALLAWRKAQAALAQYPHAVVLGADTVVTLDDLVLNKPRDASHARAMLARLSGRTHTVYTGLCVVTRQQQLFELVASDVSIAPLHAEQIDSYVETGEPMDKAGAYGIQGDGGQLVQRVVGSYTAVVGLPLPATRHLLSRAGILSLTNSNDAYYTWLHNQRKEPLPCPPTLP